MEPRKRQHGDASASTPAADDEPTHRLVASADQRHAFSSSLAALWREEQLCDVTIVVDSGERFPAHKIVLAASSDYFRSLFKSGMRDSGRATLSVSEVDAASFKAVLSFLYDQILEVRPSTLGAIMLTASRLEVGSLLELGAGLIAESLTVETCIASWSVAESLDRPEMSSLREACTRTAANNFNAFAAQPGFKSLTKDQLTAVLAADDLLDSEQAAFSALLGWLVEQQPPLAEAAALELLSLIRYPYMDPEFLASNVEAVLRSFAGGENLLLEAYRWKSMPAAQRQQDNSARTRSRRPRLPRGVQLNVPAEFLDAWTCHMEAGYDVPTRIEHLNVPAEATHVFVGARRPDGTIALGACGRRDKVLQMTQSMELAFEENGAFWYCVDEVSFGFSASSSIRLQAADTFDDDDDTFDDKRLSWHLEGGDGWRAGAMRELDDEEWKKLVYWIRLPWLK